MALRVAVAGFSHETNTFAWSATGLDEFIANGLLRAEEILDLAGT
ncbi:MAG: Metallopeptidase family, partial [Thermomicrobiales bacterium]|nr:Metallopeptidase family [Thermomicrobiales bacterium]